jgi:hypothetical protein
VTTAPAVDLAARCGRTACRVDRRRQAAEGELIAAVLCRPTPGYLTARAAGVSRGAFADAGYRCLWDAAERGRHRDRRWVWADAAGLLLAAGLWRFEAYRPGRWWAARLAAERALGAALPLGPFAGVVWAWADLIETTTCRRYDPAAVRRWAAAVLDYGRREREAARALDYAACVLAGRVPAVREAAKAG